MRSLELGRADNVPIDSCFRGTASLRRATFVGGSVSLMSHRHVHVQAKGQGLRSRARNTPPGARDSEQLDELLDRQSGLT